MTMAYSKDTLTSSAPSTPKRTPSPNKFFPRFSRQSKPNDKMECVSESEVSKIADKLAARGSTEFDEQSGSIPGPITRSRGLKGLLKTMQL
jgi:hypothetical protein